MNKNQIQKSKNAIKIKTPMQANFHLNQGEVLALDISRTECVYISKDNEADNNYNLAIVPKFGLAKQYEGDFQAVSEIVKEYEFYVVKGAYLTERKISALDKIFNKLQLLLGRKLS